MKHETLWFRLAVGALMIAGLLVLSLSLRGRHPLPRENNATLPSVAGPAPPQGR